MKKLLVTGASGFLGWNLCQLAHPEWEVYGIYYSQRIELTNVNLVQGDLSDFITLKSLFAQIQPDAVIHAAAKSSPNYCQTHTTESYPVNVTASHNIAGLCADASIPCVFTSTDLVFNGLNPPYSETDAVSPINHYGEQKVLAEQGMLERHPKTVICRMPLMFGATPSTASSFIQPFIKTLRNGKALSLFTDEIRTPVSGQTAAKGLLLALDQQKQGLLHLGGKEAISRYDFGLLMAEVLKLHQDQITPCLQKDVPMAAPRPANTSLDSSQAFALGYSPLSLREQLAALVSQL